MLIDSHCHLDLSAFDHDRNEVIQHALNVGVSQCMIPGTTISQLSHLLALAKRYAFVDIAFGLHPYFLNELTQKQLNTAILSLSAAVKQHRHNLVALGEIGLDGSLNNMSLQIRAFEQQLALADEYHLPLVLHHRQSHNETIRILKQYKPKYGGLLHAFSGSLHEANSYLELGFSLGVGGTITYERAKKTRNTIKNIDMKHLLLETDSPDMPLSGFQGQRNTPAQLCLVAEALSSLKMVTLKEVAIHTTKNYTTLFHS